MLGNPPMAHQVFLCYAHDDRAIAEAACARLEANSIPCWVAPRDVTPGMDWGAEIIEAITASRVMVLILSANANESVQVKREVERAVNKRVTVLPFRIENVNPSRSLEYFLSSTHWLDAIGSSAQDHLGELVATVAEILGESQEVSPDTPRLGGVLPVAPSKQRFGRRAAAVAGVVIVLAGGWYASSRTPVVPAEIPSTPAPQAAVIDSPLSHAPEAQMSPALPPATVTPTKQGQGRPTAAKKELESLTRNVTTIPPGAQASQAESTAGKAAPTDVPQSTRIRIGSPMSNTYVIVNGKGDPIRLTEDGVWFPVPFGRVHLLISRLGCNPRVDSSIVISPGTNAEPTINRSAICPDS